MRTFVFVFPVFMHFMAMLTVKLRKKHPLSIPPLLGGKTE